MTDNRLTRLLTRRPLPGRVVALLPLLLAILAACGPATGRGPAY